MMRIETSKKWTVAELREALEGANAEDQVTFGSLRKADQKNECWCGCGGLTGGKFCPGHDSKFHSLAKCVARGEAERPESFVCPEAEVDFDKWHDREKPIADAKANLKRVQEAAKPPTPVVESVEPVEGEELSELLDEVTAE